MTAPYTTSETATDEELSRRLGRVIDENIFNIPVPGGAWARLKMNTWILRKGADYDGQHE